MTHPRQMLAVFIKQLGRERTGADARGVGLHNADDFIEARGPRPVPVPA